jgi:uncharacterized membrane protein
VGLLTQVPLVALALIGQDEGRLYFTLSGVLGMLYGAALTVGVAALMRGERPAVAAMMSGAFARSGGLILASFASGLAVVLGLLLLVVPGVVAWTGLFVTVPVLLNERGVGPGEALGRSWALTRGRRTAIFVVGLVFLLTTFGAFAAVGLLVQAFFGEESRAAAVLSELVSVPILGLYGTAPAVAYHELRGEAEGGAPRLAAVFD